MKDIITLTRYNEDELLAIMVNTVDQYRDKQISKEEMIEDIDRITYVLQNCVHK